MPAARDDLLFPGSLAMVRLLSRRLKRSDKLAGFQIIREQDHLLARAAELLDVLVHDAAELRLQHRGLLALAIRRKRDRTDDSLVRILAQIFCHRLLVERTHGLDGLFGELAAGIAKRRQIVAERIDLRLDGPLAVLLEELLGPLEIHALFREP